MIFNLINYIYQNTLRGYSYLLLIFIFLVSVYVRYTNKNQKINKPRLAWGVDPIINFFYWSKAMKEAGYQSKTYVTEFYSINKRKDWDYVVSDYTHKNAYVRQILRLHYTYYLFLKSLYHDDVFFMSVNGFLLSSIGHYKAEGYFLRIARKKTVILPYGSDAYVYRNIRYLPSLHCLLINYPNYAKKQELISKRVNYWCKYADCLIPGTMGPDGFGRWDVLTPSSLSIDLDLWKVNPLGGNMSKQKPLKIAHSPNHRGVKGTEFLVKAVENLKEQGFNIELILIEKLPNSEVRRLLHDEADILVELLIGPGHGISAIEGMSSGIPVISNLEFDEHFLPFRRWSFFDECPIVSASPENIEDILIRLYEDESLRKKLGEAGRAYVEKYHGFDSAQYLFKNVIEYVFGRKESLINLYHPLLGEYPNRSPKIEHPLVNSRIVG